MQEVILEKSIASEVVISSKDLLEHWQAHRRLTRKVIEAFPEKDLFTFSISPMRPFSEMVVEMLDMAAPGVAGIVSGEWQKFADLSHVNGKTKPETKEELLKLWDETTERLNTLWKQIPPHRFQETDVAFGMYEGTIYSFILYFIDNDIHHRGQAYVYLRSLGIEPPAFYDRG